MKFGIICPNHTESWKAALRAEARGFDVFGFWDSPLFAADIFTTMAVAASKTSSIRLMSSVYVPWTRNPAVTACGFASLNALAPGRIDFCASTGFSARRGFGLPGMRVADLETHLRAAFGLLRGEDVDLEIEGRVRRVRLVDRLGMNLADPIGLHVAAGGPKMRTLVAELGVGWLDAPSIFGDARTAMSDMRKTWTEANRIEADLFATILLPNSAILREGETATSTRVMDLGGGKAMAAVHFWVDHVLLQGHTLPDFVPEPVRIAVEGYIEMFADQAKGEAPYLELHKGHGLYVRPEEQALLTPELVAATSFVASPKALLESIESHGQSGVDQVLFSMMPGHDYVIDDLAEILDLERRAS